MGAINKMSIMCGKKFLLISMRTPDARHNLHIGGVIEGEYNLLIWF